MIKEQLMNDMKQYMKEKKKIELTGIRMVNASIKNKEIDLKRELTDDEVVTVIKKQVKEHKESLEYVAKNGDIASQEELNTYIAILEKYLPEQMDESQAREIIEGLLKENDITSVKQKGNAMKVIMPVLKGKLDGAIINKIVSDILA